MRWRALFFHPGDPNPNEEPKNLQTYGLKTNKCPPQVPAMKKFEADLINISTNLKFRKTTNDFQKKLKNDMKSLRDSNKTMTPADKTTNYYRLTKEEYNNLKTNAITSTYKKGNIKMKTNIDKSGAKFAKKQGFLKECK